ncbi:MAG: beta-lactamase family protein [Burkholderiales bacterium]|nr:beta-lactamase family protein [Burkholderiales bacterium]
MAPATLALMVGLLAACSSPPPPAEPVALGDWPGVQRQLQVFIDHEMRAAKVTGLSIALVNDQQVLWQHGAGWADQAGGVAAGPDTLYRMGSITKLFSDSAAMQLVAQGQLDLDAPVQRVLPEFKLSNRWPDAPAITVRQLMTHHAGLPRDRLGGMWGSSVGDFRDITGALADEAAEAPAGAVFDYSNVGLTLLGVVVERAGGEPFEAQVQRRLLTPLGMDGATLVTAVPDSPHMARAYQAGEAKQEPALRDVPAGGLVASVRDMARFVSMQFAQGRNAQGDVVLPQPQWAEMLTVQNKGVVLDAGFELGLGWMFTTFGADTVHGGGPVAHHAGATFYHRAQLMMLPEQRLGVVVAANDAAAGPVVSRIAQRALALMLEAQTGRRQVPAVPGFTPAAAPWTAAQRQACVGDYITPAGVVAIQAEGDALTAQLDGRTLRLLEGADGRIGLQYRLGGILTISLGVLEQIGVECTVLGGVDVLVAHLDGQTLRVGARLPPALPLPTTAQALTGTYEPVLAPGEAATIDRVVVQVRQGRLWATATTVPAFGHQSMSLPLHLVSDTEARFPGPLGDDGVVMRLRTGAPGALAVRFAGADWVRVAGPP